MVIDIQLDTKCHHTRIKDKASMEHSFVINLLQDRGPSTNLYSEVFIKLEELTIAGYGSPPTKGPSFPLPCSNTGMLL